MLQFLMDKLRLAREIKKVDSNISNSPSIIPDANNILSTQPKQEKDINWFTQKKNLLEDFVGEPPIVTTSNFGLVEIDPNTGEHITKNGFTIKKQDQYLYRGENKTIEEEDEWLLLKGEEDNYIKDSKVLKAVIPSAKTANILNEKQLGEADWQEIKREIVDNTDADVKFIE